MTNGSYRETLDHQGLQPFLWTQFLGAFNDNLFKIVVSLLAVHLATRGGGDRELSIISAIFILPFLLFSGYAGQVADVYSKRTVLVVTKSLEIVAATLGLIAFLLGRLEITYAVLFLIALQATFFSPAKYGILPEVLPDRDLSRANGLLEMSTFVAIVVGVACGSFMFDALQDRLWIIGVVVVAVALVGTALSFRIPHVAAASPGTRIDLNPWREIGLGLKRLRGDRVLWLTVVGISYFWFMGSLLQTVMILFGSQVMALSESLDRHPHHVRGDRHRHRQHGGRPLVGRQGGTGGWRRSDRSAWASSRSCSPGRATRLRSRPSTSGWSDSSADSLPCRSTRCCSSAAATRKRAASWRPTTS